MKAKKVLRELIKFLCLVVVMVCINLVIKVAMDGMWLFDIPNPGEVTSVTVKHQYRTEDIKEITDKDQIELCVNMSGLLKYRLFANPEVATGKDSPLVTFYYHLTNGDQVEVSANATTVYYKGKKHLLKEDNSFVNIAEGLFFNGTVNETEGYILTGEIQEITDGTMIIKPVEGSVQLEVADIFAIPMEHMNPSPEPEVGDVIEVEYDGVIYESYPAKLGEIKQIDVFKVVDKSDERIVIDGVMYYNSGESVPVEPDESVIENIEIPVGGDATITEYAMLEDGKLLVCLIEGEWYKFLPVE